MDEADTGVDEADTGMDEADTGVDEADTGVDEADTGMDEVLMLLQENRWIYDFKLTRIFTDRVWEHIPAEWCQPLQDLSSDDLAGIPYGLVQDSWPTSLKDFISKCLEHSIPRQRTIGKHDSGVAPLDLEHSIPRQQTLGKHDSGVAPLDPVHIDPAVRRGMSEKKLHEVCHMTAVIDHVTKTASNDVIVDVGSGLGYLGQVLHTNYGHTVLGLEGKQCHTSGAERRAVTSEACPYLQNITCELYPTEESMVEFSTMFVDWFSQLPPGGRQCSHVTGSQRISSKASHKSNESVSQSRKKDRNLTSLIGGKESKYEISKLQPNVVESEKTCPSINYIASIDQVQQLELSSHKDVLSETGTNTHSSMRLTDNPCVVSVGKEIIVGRSELNTATALDNRASGVDDKSMCTSETGGKLIYVINKDIKDSSVIENITCGYCDHGDTEEGDSITTVCSSCEKVRSANCNEDNSNSSNSHQESISSIRKKSNFSEVQESKLKDNAKLKVNGSILEQSQRSEVLRSGQAQEASVCGESETIQARLLHEASVCRESRTVQARLSQEASVCGESQTIQARLSQEASVCGESQTIQARLSQEASVCRDSRTVQARLSQEASVCGESRTIQARQLHEASVCGESQTVQARLSQEASVCGESETLRATQSHEASVCGESQTIQARQLHEASVCGESRTIQARLSQEASVCGESQTLRATQSHEASVCGESRTVQARLSQEASVCGESQTIQARLSQEASVCRDSRTVQARLSQEASVCGESRTIQARQLHEASVCGESQTVQARLSHEASVCGESRTIQATQLQEASVCGESETLRATQSHEASVCGESRTVQARLLHEASVCMVGLPHEASVCMVGLHCCGDLTPTMLRCFKELEFVRSLCCVSCCYHRMTVHEGSGEFDQFPMSASVQRSMRNVRRRYPNWTLNVYCMRLAAQETRARWQQQTVQDHEKHMRNVAYRGLLEMCLERGKFELQKAARRLVHKPALASYKAYVDTVARQILSTDSSDVDQFKTLMHDLYEEHKAFFSFIEPITALQVLVQPVLESLIYTDRLHWIQEQGYHGNIMPIFDEYLSPRNLAIVVIK